MAASINVTVKNEVGLHARPAAMFVKKASSFKSKVMVENVTRATAPVNAKSILSVLSIGVLKDHEIRIQAEGEDEESAIKSLVELIESDFGE
ncbi:MAG TPA: HPr family phosphocarrier protein [Chloroflexi bacterium]|nr:HPr family phosphocarrier protein [Chloroflexota bacterium]HPO57739.1 HPr family phosphocarrier protein [Anaerolineaceae bacterium]